MYIDDGVKMFVSRSSLVREACDYFRARGPAAGSMDGSQIV